MNKSDAYLLLMEFLLTLGVIVYFSLFKQQSLLSLWQEYGIPLLIALIIFTTFPLYRLFTALKK